MSNKKTVGYLKRPDTDGFDVIIEELRDELTLYVKFDSDYIDTEFPKNVSKNEVVYKITVEKCDEPEEQ